MKTNAKFITAAATAIVLALPVPANAGYFDQLTTQAAGWWTVIKTKVNDTLAAWRGPVAPPADAPAVSKVADPTSNQGRSAQVVPGAPPARPSEHEGPSARMEREDRLQMELPHTFGTRLVIPQVHIQPALVLSRAAPAVGSSNLPEPQPFTPRVRHAVIPASALPTLAVTTPRSRFVPKHGEAEPVNPGKLQFKRVTQLVAFNDTPLEKINLLPPDTFLLIRGLFAWLLDRRDEALGILHGLGLKSTADLTRAKAFAYVGWILEDAGQKGLATLTFWRALGQHPEARDRYRDSIVLSLSRLSKETGLAKAAPTEKLLERALRAPELSVEGNGFLRMTLAERAFDRKNYSLARKVAREVPEKSTWREHARYLAATSAFAQASESKDTKDEGQNAGYRLAGKELTDLFRTVESPEIFDATAVSLGRIHFILGNYQAAHKYLSQVSRDTNVFIEAAVDNAWALLRSGDRNHAVGNMFTLHTPYFDGAYMPESYFLSSLGYQEICQFGDAITSVKNYKSRYSESFRRLIDFNAGGKATEGSYYDELVAYLGRRESKLSGIVLRELGRHPEFLRRQKEMNRLSREEGALATTFPASAAAVGGWLHDEMSSLREGYRKEMGRFMKTRAIAMEDELKFLTANISLLEYEIFAGAGSNLSLQGAQNFATDEKAVPRRNFEEGKEYWPYEDEIWEDELNNFRSKMVDGCARVKKAG